MLYIKIENYLQKSITQTTLNRPSIYQYVYPFTMLCSGLPVRYIVHSIFIVICLFSDVHLAMNRVTAVKMSHGMTMPVSQRVSKGCKRLIK